MEGDVTPPPPAQGPGERYALGPVSPPARFGPPEDLGELPEAYGTKQLLLTARDPHWLYAAWDLEAGQLRQYNARSRDRHLVLRIYLDAAAGSPHVEIHVHPESRNWFAPVGLGGRPYVAVLGYYDAQGQWETIATSKATFTPPDTLAEDTSARFATIPPEVPFEQLLEVVKTAVQEHVPLAEALMQIRAMGYPHLPGELEAQARWTPAQERALAEIISMDTVRRVWMGSLEITELVRRKLVQELASAAAPQFSAPGAPPGAVASLAGPFGGGPSRKGFWFNINAELILYGATEPNAEVSIAGRPIKLRPDGTFSYRFALPDGQYELPVVAISADQTDGRAAELKFSRRTDYRGEVGVHPQAPGLKAPLAAAME